MCNGTGGFTPGYSWGITSWLVAGDKAFRRFGNVPLARALAGRADHFVPKLKLY